MKKIFLMFLNTKKKIVALLVFITSFLSTSIFAACNPTDIACASQQTFLDNFGPGSTVVMVILGGGIIGTLIHALTTHNYKVFMIVIACTCFLTAGFAIIGA